MANTHIEVPSLGNKFVDYRQPIWGDSFNWSWNRPLEQVKFLVIHHSAGSHDATPDDVALLHKARGWSGIGYHFVITKTELFIMWEILVQLVLTSLIKMNLYWGFV